MNSQNVISIVLLVALASVVQGLPSLLPSLIPSIGDVASSISGALMPVETPDPAPVPAPASALVYSYDPYYTSPVYYRAVTPVVRRAVYVRNALNLEGLKGSLGGLLSGPARTIETIGSGIKGIVGNALESLQPAAEAVPAPARIYYAAY